MDWIALIAELMAEHRLSQPQIAAFCKCSQPSISALARGETKDPRHSIGEALKELLAAKRLEAAEKRAAAGPAGGCIDGRRGFRCEGLMHGASRCPWRTVSFFPGAGRYEGVPNFSEALRRH